MPTYEYECTKCQRRFEEFQSIVAKPLEKIKTDCTQCDNNAPVVRLLGTGSAVLFKGSGFYETDYRSKTYQDAAKADKEPSTAASKDQSSNDSASKKDTTKDSTSPKSEPKSKPKTESKPTTKTKPKTNGD